MLKKVLIAVLVAGVAFGVIQLVPYGRAHENPPVAAEPQWDSIQTHELFNRACADCHSNRTTWPWYSNIAPLSWLIQHDVNEGRSEFNASELNSRGDHAARIVQEGEMPPIQYLPLHPDARLSASERAQLAQGLAATFKE
jgi:mono/diheme cytochrome c family protein